MGNSSQLNAVGFRDAAGLAALGQAISTISEAMGPIGAAIGIGALVAGLVQSIVQSGDSELQAIEQELLAQFTQLGQRQKAEDIVQRLQNLANQATAAEGVLDGLQADLKANLSPAEKQARIETCAAMLEGFGINDPVARQAIWFAPWEDQVYWNDYQGGLGLPGGLAYCATDTDSLAATPDANGNVFSYVLILPAYLRALAMFLTEAGALDPNIIANYGQSVIYPALRLLQQWHDKIANDGIVQLLPLGDAFDRQPRSHPWDPLPAPTPWDGQGLWDAWQGMPSTIGITPQSESGGERPVSIEYGAIERFSGVSAMATYTIKLQIGFAGPGEVSVFSTDPTPYKKFQVRVLRKAKQAYIGAGLLELWKSINALRSVLGLAPLGRPNYADWSFKQIGGILGLKSLKQMKKRLESTPPLDTPPDTGILPLGFRALLEVG